MALPDLDAVDVPEADPTPEVAPAADLDVLVVWLPLAPVVAAVPVPLAAVALPVTWLSYTPISIFMQCSRGFSRATTHRRQRDA